MRKKALAAGLGLCLISAATLADSTTGTTFSVTGTPGPGRQVSVQVAVTGKHLVDGPGATVNGGIVQITVNGTVVAQVRAAVANSVIDTSESGCVRIDGNVCTLYKWVSRSTTATFPITLPTGSATAQIGAQYTGDTDSHSSTAPTSGLALRAQPDVYIVDPTNTASGHTEVHVLDFATGYSSFKLHAATALGQYNPDQAAFAVGDANNDGKPDLYLISRYGNGTPNVEVHILDGSTNYSTFLGHYSTSLPAVSGALAYTFDVGDYNRDGKPDLYVFKKVGGGSGKTEVHIYSGADGFQTALGHFAMPIGTTGDNDAWEFHVADADLDGIPDVVAVAKQDGTSTEVHILTGSSNYSTYSLETGTALGITGADSRWVFGVNDYNSDGKADVFAIDKMGAQGLEVHILRGSAYQDFLLHAGTPEGMLPSDSSKTVLINK